MRLTGLVAGAEFGWQADGEMARAGHASCRPPAQEAEVVKCETVWGGKPSQGPDLGGLHAQLVSKPLRDNHGQGKKVRFRQASCSVTVL